MSSDFRGRALPVGLVLVAMVSIQSGATVAKQLFPVLGAAGTSAMRLFFAAMILTAIWRPWRYKLSRQDLRAVVLYGAALGGMNLSFYLALVRLPLGITVAIEFIGPLALSLLTSRRVLDFVWAGLAAIGILLLVPAAYGPTAAGVAAAPTLDPVGVAFALTAALFWALYILFGRHSGTRLHSGVATTYGMITAALVVCPFGIASAGMRLVDLQVLPAALAVAALSSAIPYSLEMVAMKKLPTPTFGILMSMEPAIGALSGLFFLGERLATNQWLAIMCIMAASLGSTAGSKQVAIDA